MNYLTTVVLSLTLIDIEAQDKKQLAYQDGGDVFRFYWLFTRSRQQQAAFCLWKDNITATYCRDIQEQKNFVIKCLASSRVKVNRLCGNLAKKTNDERQRHWIEGKWRFTSSLVWVQRVFNWLVGMSYTNSFAKCTMLNFNRIDDVFESECWRVDVENCCWFYDSGNFL